MPRKIVTFRDKYNSTTRIYPKIIMECLSPEVKDYIESQGNDKFVKKEEIKSQYKSSKILSEGDEISLLITDTESDMFGNIRISDSEFIAEVGTTDNDYYQISLTNTGDFAITTNDGTNIHQLTFDAEGNLKVDNQAVGGGKQLYQHNVKATKTGTINFYGVLTIINDSPTQFNLTSLKQYLTTKGYDDTNHRLCNGGFATNGSALYVAESICIYDYYGDMIIRYYYANNSGTVQGSNDVNNSMVIEDNVETL